VTNSTRIVKLMGRAIDELSGAEFLMRESARLVTPKSFAILFAIVRERVTVHNRGEERIHAHRATRWKSFSAKIDHSNSGEWPE
jgi:hypothetical protein